ncbi:MAG: riboflavin synthase [Lactococcus lactis]|nr:riboflavin synthase [Lactococcus lactis]MDN6422844.1 riboflavin synthase [Tetragenococcus koreensis]MDN5947803.1 riboflavin synthase [Lactococcus lactis]MDN5950033.1 riboflavin synthase [Lactococcus lactis]MDN5961000.1 riboflavin synthase [Lactococcus lactis]
MFTGIIEELGEVSRLQKREKSFKISIRASLILEDMKLGDSISTNGLCLTVSEFNQKEFTADIMPESLNRSNLGTLNVGAKVNLERAMPLNGRFGGHIVSGHIDGVGQILEVKKEENAIWFEIKTSLNLMRYTVEKGSITIDGISLTVAQVKSKSFSVSIIPHTLKKTIMADKKVGDTVNLENDILGKYIEKLWGDSSSSMKESSVTKEKLFNNGFL